MDHHERRLAARLAAALCVLTERQKAIFLAATKDATYADIAADLDIDVADVERDLALALEALDIAVEQADRAGLSPSGPRR